MPITAWIPRQHQLDFRKTIWIAPVVWTIHESEEWNIMTFERTHFADPEHFSQVDHPVLCPGLAQVGTLSGILWTSLTAWPKNPKFAAFLALPFFTVFSFANVLQHIYNTLHFRGYTPGVATASLLVGPVVIGLTVKAIRGNLSPDGMRYFCTF